MNLSNENNEWKTIFHTISPALNGFKNEHNSHKTYYPATAKGSLKTVLKGGEVLHDMLDMNMYFFVNGNKEQIQTIKNEKGIVEVNKLLYPNIYGNGIDLQLTQETSKRKMDYVIHSLSALGSIPSNASHLVFEETVELPLGWTAELKDNIILLRDIMGEIKALYEKPYLEDAPKIDVSESNVKSYERNSKTIDHVNNSLSQLKSIGEYTIEQDGKSLTIQTSVTIEWITDTERRFPVKIDPTVNVIPNNATNWTGFVYDDGDYVSNTVFTGRYIGYFMEGSLRFNSSSIPSGSSVSAATGFVNIISITGSTNNTWAFSNSSDPLTVPSGFSAQGTGLYNSMSTAHSATTTVGAMGQRSSVFSMSGRTYLENSFNDGFISMGIYTLGSFPNNEYFQVSNYSSTDKPYLEITYTSSAGYCTSVPIDDGYDDGITNVSFNTINNTTSTNAGTEYTDFNSSGATTTILTDSTYDLNVSVNTDGNYTYYQRVWIDWNQDEDFDDPGESYNLGTVDDATNGVSSLCPISVTVPANAIAGSTRMRVSSKWNNYPTPCENSFDGEVEDYTITVNDQCATAISMTCGTDFSGTLGTSGAWVDYTDCGNWQQPGGEEVYTYTPSSSGSHTFTATETSGDPDFFLMSSCGENGNNLTGGCWDNGDRTVNLVGGTTYYLIVDNYSSSSSASFTVSVESSGNPASFGDQVWNVHGYNGNNTDISLNDYQGFYVQPDLGAGNLGVATRDYWSNSKSPSSAGTSINNGDLWQGCNDVNNNIHSFTHKRKGFPCGNYTFDMNYWDDETRVIIDGANVWSCGVWQGNNGGYSNSNSSTYSCAGTTTFQFSLDVDSEVEFQTLEGGGGSNLGVDIALISPQALTTTGTPERTCKTSGSDWISFVDEDNNLIAVINPNGENLGDVTIKMFLGSPLVMQGCILPTNAINHISYMGRRWVMSSSLYPNGIDFNNNVTVQLPYTTNELAALNTFAQTSTIDNPLDGGTTDPPATRNNLMLTKITGSSEDGIANQLDCANTIRGIASSASGNSIQSLSNTEYVEFNIGQFSEFFLHKDNDGSALPVTLTDFSASCNDEVLISWTTASEQNSDYFDVEKSRDGQTWVHIANQQSAGNSSSEINYSQSDYNSMSGITYYRLKQVDFNGEEEIYGPISVSCEEGKSSMKVYPNPNNGSFTIEVSSDKIHSDVYLYLTDMTGKVILTQKVNITNGTTQILMGDLDLRKGLYWVSMEGIQTQLKPLMVVVN